MIYDGATLPRRGKMKADLVVVGSGPGGAMVAKLAAEAGGRVVLLESGGLVTPAQMTQREEEMLPQLFRLSGSFTTEDRAVKVHQGKGLGGSSLHNLNLSKRIPIEIQREWHERRAVTRLSPEVWSALYDEVEELLEVSAVDPARWSRHNRLLEAGVKKLGWKGGGLSHNRTGCLESGFCELGCAYDAKNNALKVLIPPAVRAGCTVLTNTHALHLEYRDGAVTGLVARTLDPKTQEPLGTLEIEAPRVCLSASATGTATILLRSHLRDDSAQTGRNLHIHPAVVVAGDFEEPVRAWEGIPQTYECTEHLGFEEGSPRTWIVPAFGHPMSFAALLPGHGKAHRELMERYAHLGVLTAMLHDHTRGTVRSRGELEFSVDYWPEAEDRQQLVNGMAACARLWFAAGAKRVFVPAEPILTLDRVEEIEKIERFELTRGATDLTAVHPMSTVPMSDDPHRGPVGSDGQHHGLHGLWVADGSLFPTSIGGPPQLSIYALGLHVGRAIVAAG